MFLSRVPAAVPTEARVEVLLEVSVVIPTEELPEIRKKIVWEIL